MKVKIREDEWWPVYTIIEPENYGEEVDLPEDLVKRLVSATKAFEKAQKEVRLALRDMEVSSDR